MASIDLTYLNEISGGDKEFIAEMIETFLEETPKDIAELEKLLADENWTAIGLVAHKLKSSIKMFGFEDVKNMAVYIEQSGKKGENLDVLAQKSHEFLTALHGALDELRTHL